MIKLDPEAFKAETGGGRWQAWETARHRQFDLVVMAQTDDFRPAPQGLAQLEQALERIDALYDMALVAARIAWAEFYKAPARDATAWSLTSLIVEETGDLRLVLYEEDYDTYGAWDVTMRDGVALKVERRQI